MPSETRRCLHKSEYSGNLFQVGRLAQLARAPRLHRGCQGFESLIAHCVMCQDIVPVFWHILFCFCVGMCQDIVPFLSVMVVAGRSF